MLPRGGLGGHVHPTFSEGVSGIESLWSVLISFRLYPRPTPTWEGTPLPYHTRTVHPTLFDLAMPLTTVWVLWRDRQVCSICGLHVRFHDREPEPESPAEDKMDSARVSETGSLDQYNQQEQQEPDGPGGGDALTVPAASALVPPAVAYLATASRSVSRDGRPLDHADRLPSPADNFSQGRGGLPQTGCGAVPRGAALHRKSAFTLATCCSTS